MCDLNVIIQLARVFTSEIAFRTGEMAGIRGFELWSCVVSGRGIGRVDWRFMSFPTIFSITTGSSLEMVTDRSYLLICGMV